MSEDVDDFLMPRDLSFRIEEGRDHFRCAGRSSCDLWFEFSAQFHGRRIV